MIILQEQITDMVHTERHWLHRIQSVWERSEGKKVLESLTI